MGIKNWKDYIMPAASVVGGAALATYGSNPVAGGAMMASGLGSGMAAKGSRDDTERINAENKAEIAEAERMAALKRKYQWTTSKDLMAGHITPGNRQSNASANSLEAALGTIQQGASIYNAFSGSAKDVKKDNKPVAKREVATDVVTPSEQAQPIAAKDAADIAGNPTFDRSGATYDYSPDNLVNPRGQLSPEQAYKNMSKPLPGEPKMGAYQIPKDTPSTQYNWDRGIKKEPTLADFGAQISPAQMYQIELDKMNRNGY